MELNLLEYLIAFSETGSLSKASEQLFISQPSLTKAMKKLEAELGIQIFNRSKNHLALNENGYIVLDYAKSIKNTKDNLMDFAKRVKENEEEVLIGMVGPGPSLYYRSLLEGKSHFGKYVTEIKTKEELLSGLYEGHYDFIFLSEEVNKKGYLCKKVFDEHLYVSLPKEHFLVRKTDGLFCSEIDGQTFLVNSSVGVWKELLESKLPKSKLIFHADEEALSEMRKHSSLCAFSTNLTPHEEDSDNRVNIPLKDKEATVSFYLMMKENYVHCFQEFITYHRTK